MENLEELRRKEKRILKKIKELKNRKKNLKREKEERKILEELRKVREKIREKIKQRKDFSVAKFGPDYLSDLLGLELINGDEEENV